MRRWQPCRRIGIYISSDAASAFPQEDFSGLGGGGLLPTGSGEAHSIAGMHSADGFNYQAAG
jgi:hypothetical protein